MWLDETVLFIASKICHAQSYHILLPLDLLCKRSQLTGFYLLQINMVYMRLNSWKKAFSLCNKATPIT